jgi:hypothetical protein
MDHASIAQEIARQIGPQAFFLLGTTQRHIDDDAPGLVFNVRGSKTCTKIWVRLDDDTYTVTFFKIGRAPSFKITSQEFAGIYCDMLHDLIEENTGLYVSLSPRS